MNKLPTKQIYLLLVIIIGIIALSIYSTYAIFTFESETSEVVNIKLPTNIMLKTDITEYKQIEVKANSVSTTDVDMYNTFEYNICYSIWYKIVKENNENVEIYQYNTESLNTSGIVEANTNLRTTLLIINDNDKDIKINFGIATTKETETCILNLSKDKKTVKNLYSERIQYLNEKIIDNSGTNVKDNEDGFLIEKDLTQTITYSDKITIANKFEVKDEKFTLIEPITTSIKEFEENSPNINYQEKDYYICNTDCSILYKVKESKINKKDEKNIKYEITNYDKYEGYLKGTSGIKKVNENYYYYGDNPNNYIYYNCNNNECELWRIVGAFYNEKTKKYDIKIVKNNSIGKYQYNDNDNSNEWTKSTLYKYLNSEYKINNFKKLTTNYPYRYEELTTLNIDVLQMPNSIISTKEKDISILNLSDYLNTSTCQNSTIDKYGICLNNNWLNRAEIKNEWLLTLNKKILIEDDKKDLNTNLVNPGEESNNSKTEQEFEPTQPDDTTILNNENNPINEEIINEVYTKELKPILITEKLSVRPVVYLKDRVLLYSGNGTIDNPYIIK